MVQHSCVELSPESNDTPRLTSHDASTYHNHLFLTTTRQQLITKLFPYTTLFRSPDVTDVDKVLIAGAFVQTKEPDRTFSTKEVGKVLVCNKVKLNNGFQYVG